MKGIGRSQPGFTLMEVVVSMAIISMVMATIGTAMFQALGTERVVVDDGLAINELRRAISYLAGDVKMAKTTSLVDGAGPVTSCTLNWTDEYQDAQVAHTSSYSVVEDRLVRTYDGSEQTVARRLVSASFSRTGRAIIGEFEVAAGAGTTRTLSTKAVMRPAP